MGPLSDEQMNCVTGSGAAAWVAVERPVGPQPLPAWVAGAHADFMDTPPHGLRSERHQTFEDALA